MPRSLDPASTNEHFYRLSNDLLAIGAHPARTWIRVNPAFRRTLGWSENELRGTPLERLVHADDLAPFEAAAARLDHGEQLVDIECRVRCKEGSYICVAWRLKADIEDGLIYLVGCDVSGRQAEQALRESEERFRAFVNASSDVVYRMSPDWSLMRQLDGRGFLADTAAPSGTWMSNYILPDDQPMVTAAIEHAIRDRIMFELTHRVRLADGGVGWTFSRATPILDQGGEIIEWLGAASDVTERKRAEVALRESEERFRSFADMSTDTLWIMDAATGKLEYLSPAFEQMWGERRDVVLADLDRWREMIHPDDREQVAKALPRVLAGEAHTAEYRIVSPSTGAVRWIHDTGFPIRGSDGQVVRAGGIAQDMTEERDAARHTATLLAELQHRVRNVLAVTRSIARRSNDGERSTEDYVQHLDGRLAALARTQVLLTRKADAGVALEDLVRDELHVQVASEGQVDIAGPEVELAPKAAEVLTLAIHELTTNSTKYGALSRREGRLQVQWTVERRDDRPWLILEWIERGVPVLEAAPRREGFGLELITLRVPYELKGRGTFDLKPGGLQSRVEFPLVAGESILQTGGVAQ